MQRRLPLLACCLLALVACDTQSDTSMEQPPAPPEPAPLKEGQALTPTPTPTTDCTYAYDAENTKLTWTSFKLTERVGVAGTFKDITVEGTKEADTPQQVFEGMHFEINTASIDSGSPERDPKIIAAFFGTLTDGGNISGKVTGVADDKGTIELTLGGVTKPIEMALAVDGQTLTATGKVDVGNFDGSEAIAALNKVCEEKHTGEDGTSKLWPDVELKVETTLDKICK